MGNYLQKILIKLYIKQELKWIWINLGKYTVQGVVVGSDTLWLGWMANDMSITEQEEKLSTGPSLIKYTVS